MIVYQDVLCPNCGGTLYLDEQGAVAVAFCRGASDEPDAIGCGPVHTYDVRSCGNQYRPGCGEHIFMAGPDGHGRPISLVTGANHFFNCPQAGNFRAAPKPAKPPKPTEESPQQSLF